MSFLRGSAWGFVIWLLGEGKVLCFGVLRVSRGSAGILFNLDPEAHPQRTMAPLQTLISSPTLSSSSAGMGVVVVTYIKHGTSNLRKNRRWKYVGSPSTLLEIKINFLKVICSVSPDPLGPAGSVDWPCCPGLGGSPPGVQKHTALTQMVGVL